MSKKRPLLIHTVWGLSTVATFAFGYQLARGRMSDSLAQSTRSSQMIEAQSQALNARGIPGGGGTGKGGVQKEGADGAFAAKRVLTKEQIEKLSKDALDDPNPLTRDLAFAKLLESLTPENVESVMETLKTNRAGGDQWQLFLYAWGAMDGKGAMAHAETLEGDRKARFLNATLPGWAGKNPDAAIAWLDTMKEGDDKEKLRGSLVAGLADNNIGLATDYALQRARAGDKQADSYMETVAGEEMRKNGPAAAAAWGEALPEGAAKGVALDRIAGEFARRDPAAASAWAAKFANTDYGAKVVEEVGQQWAGRDPKAAVAWLDTLQDGSAGKSEGTYSALREWTDRDPMAASQYLSNMPNSQAKDSAVSGFARSLAKDDPESAIIWAKTISDPESRDQTMTRTGQAWFRRDPVSASNWLQTSNVSPAVREAILNPKRDDQRRRRG